MALAAILIAVAAIVFVPSSKRHEERMQLQAIGGTWSITQVSWREFQGAWVLQTTLKPHRTKLNSTPSSIVFRSFCGSLLTKLPKAPEGIKRENVFRVAVNVEGANGAPGAAFPRFVPIQISDGKCQINDADEAYFPSYPGNLAAFKLTETMVQTRGSHEIRVNFVQQDPKADVSLDYSLACKAFLFDGMPTLDETLALAKIDKRPDELVLHILHKKQRNFGILKTFAAWGAKFKVVGGTCVGLQEADL